MTKGGCAAIFLGVLVACLFAVGAAQTMVEDSQAQALDDLCNANIRQDNWVCGGGSLPCSWYGVTCDSTGTNIIGLYANID